MVVQSSRSLALAGVLSSLLRPVASFSTAKTSCLDDLTWFPKLESPQPSSSFLEVYNPADASQIVARLKVATRSDVRKSIELSEAVLPKWRDGTTASYRSSLLTKWSNLIQQHRLDIAKIMTLESGKPLGESLGEVNYGTSFLDYYASEALRPSGSILPTTFSTADGITPRGRSLALTQAVGVTGLITPWNFPIAMITRKVGPALAAGCTSLVKPSELTPLTAILIQELAEQAGIPKGVLQTIITDREHTPDVGHELCTHPAIRKISFTGSTPVGRQLMEWSASTVKRLSLELGGNAPFIVFDDADIDQAVAAAMASKFRNAGQTCVCADRFLVHSSIHNDFMKKFVDKINKLIVGNGLDESVTMGPLISAEACNRVHEKVQDAINRGARLLVGGSKLEVLGDNFYRPTVLTDVSPEADIWKTETFGPVAAVCTFETEDEALQLANDSPVGLASYFLTRDLGRTFRVMAGLEAGIVGVNDGIISTCTAPFGGIKESGLGREGSTDGLQEYMETKYVFINY